MKRERISEAIGNIGIHHVQEAGCYNMAGKHNRRKKGGWSKTAVAAAILFCVISVCVCIPSIASSIEGFYKDVVRWWDGAVVGTEYENATQEIQIQAAPAVVEDGKLVIPLTVTFLEMGNKEPYISLIGGAVALGDYQIIDTSGTEIYSDRGQQETVGELEDGKTAFMQPAGIETLSKGTKYMLVIESIYGLQKAEQPLEMKGHWECEFTVGE